ncbi:MAG: hypothetical protein RL071_3548, partial [Pseudomonadota bacterium]
RCWATPAGPGAEALLDAAVRGAAAP